MLSEMLSPLIKKQVDTAVEVLRRGGVIAFPTETVYGLAADIKQPEAIRRIFSIKGRETTKALPLILSNINQFKQVAENIPEVAWLLIEKFWPGPLTLVVYKSRTVPDIVTSGQNTVAVRISAHPIATALAESLGNPVTGTSANRSGLKSAVTHEDVAKQIGDKVDFIIEAGSCPFGLESTIVDVTKEIPVILREGAVPREVLKEICQIS